MSELAGLDLAGRAALLGVTCREYLQLAYSDPRIVADEALATPNAQRRLRAWIAAGKPDVAADAVVFRGADSIRPILIATLADVPAPMRWLPVSWFEIGRDAPVGYATSLAARALDGDVHHAIVIDGRVSDAALQGLICHELAHAWHREWRADSEAELSMTEREHDARVLAALDGDRHAAARLLYRGERLADDCARAWGHPTDEYLCTGAARVRHFRERMDAAADLAADISRKVDDALAARAAAVTNTRRNT